jgi:hypothetical protein
MSARQALRFNAFDKSCLNDPGTLCTPMRFIRLVAYDAMIEGGRYGENGAQGRLEAARLSDRQEGAA